MATKAKTKRRPTREQIRVWLGTVLSPLLRALDVELTFVSQRNWSFRCESRDFEYLWPTAMMVGFPHRANAEQVFRYFPTLQKSTTAHDNALGELRAKCQAGYEALLASPDFQSLPVPPDSRAEERKYFAEYVVNGIRDLPAHYAFADFWRAAGIEYLSLRTHPTLRALFQSLDSAGESFEKHAITLRKDVKVLQENLADEAGLPPVPDPS